MPCSVVESIPIQTTPPWLTVVDRLNRPDQFTPQRMHRSAPTIISTVSLAILSTLLVGCASHGVRNPSGAGVTVMKADEQGFVAGTGVESQDIVSVSDKMARSILETPQIQQAQGQPRVVLLPIENNTRFAINKDILLTRVRARLNSQTRGKVLFLARERMAALEKEQQLKQSGQVTTGSDPNVVEFQGADFFLTGRLDGSTTRNARGISDYVLYTFQLIDARTSVIIWEDMAEVKKQGLEDAAYR
jgi:PBP1b-binding outer membrane lipoprotein LpoB